MFPFSFTKTEKKETGSLSDKIKSFAPLIKTATGLNIDGILDIFLQGIKESKKRIGSELMLMMTGADNHIRITVYAADQEAGKMDAIYTTAFATTYEAIDELGKMADFLNTYTHSENVTPENNADTTTNGNESGTDTAAAAAAGTDTASGAE